jgi:hypothetical protein
LTRADAAACLAKAEPYVSSAQDNLVVERFTVAAGDAIHAGISAKDAIMTALTGITGKNKDHLQAAKELRQALGDRADAPTRRRSPRRISWSRAGRPCGR